MISVYTISDYIHLLTNKRACLYYRRHKLATVSINNAIRLLNKVLVMLRGFNSKALISIDAYGKYTIDKDLKVVKNGRFNCDVLGGMQ